MHVIVPLWMMTWSNTFVYSCECVCFIFCFVLLFNLVNVFFYVSCVVWCLLTCSIFRCNWRRDRIGGMNMYVCIYVCMYVWSWVNTLRRILSLPKKTIDQLFQFNLTCLDLFGCGDNGLIHWDDCCFPLQRVHQFVVSMVSSMYKVVTTHLQMNLS